MGGGVCVDCGEAPAHHKKWVGVSEEREGAEWWESTGRCLTSRHFLFRNTESIEGLH